MNELSNAKFTYYSAQKALRQFKLHTTGAIIYDVQ